LKKNYSKPDILFESFALSVDIAGGCERIIDTHLGGQCAMELVGLGNVFTNGVTECEMKIEDGSEMVDYLCYHVPTADNNLFNS